MVILVVLLSFLAVPNAVQAAPDPPPLAPNFEIVVVPDTQYYALPENSPKFFSQTQFIADRQPAFALHVGDIVHRPRLEEQWDIADEAWDLVDAAGVPYSVAYGNHDGDAIANDTVLYNQHFGTARYENYSWYGGNFGEGNENHFELFSAGGTDFLIVSIGWDPTPDEDVLKWADGLLKAHRDRIGIVLSHELLSQDGSWAAPGEDIYHALKDNANLRMMFAGHYTGDRFRSDTFNGNTIHTMMVDYQHREGNGNGFLRLLEVDPNSGVVNATTYSPYLDEYDQSDAATYSFTVNLNPEPAHSELSVSVSSSTNGVVPAAFSDEDVLTLEGGDWSLTHDGSAIGYSTDVNAFERLSDGSILVSFDRPTTIGGVRYDDSDVVKIADDGTASMFLKGSTVELTTSSEDIDALSLTPDGRLLISTLGTARSAAGITDDSDVLVLENDVLSVLLRGADYGLTTSTEDIGGLSVDADGTIYLSTAGSFTLLSGHGGGRSDLIALNEVDGHFEIVDPSTWNSSIEGMETETIDALSIRAVETSMAPATELRFGNDGEIATSPIVSFPRQDAGSYELAPDGRSITLRGNSWKTVLINYEVTLQTVLEFEFSSTQLAEIHGIGLGWNYFQLDGTQRWANQDYRSYGDSRGTTMSFTIPVGQLISNGVYTELVLINDHDRAPSASNGTFSHIVLRDTD